MPKEYRVLFYKSSNGGETVLDWIRSFDADDKKAIGEDLRVVQFGFPLGLPLCRSLGEGLWEIRTKLPSRHTVRLFFFQQGDALVVVHGIVKKTQKTPASELALARRRKREMVP